MALALYRKYRPRTFAEVIGQEHVTEPLSQALRSGRLNHAYLFSGPRGCGKTSSARILARSLNCEQGPTPDPCGVCASCKSLANDGAGSIDVIEIDAASHGGVDDARELREKAFFAPASSRYKIYVIDEAHMVSSAGFNALLKLVEEPPDYVKFIFATTEPDKVLGTIRSRTHHYPFRLIPPAVLRPYLQQLTDAEGVTVEPSVFPLVVRAGGGSARDTLSILDQLIAGSGPDGVTYARAVGLLGVTDVTLIDEMCEAIATGDGAAAYATIDRVAEAGHEPRRFASDLLERFRDLIVLQQVPDAVAKGLIDGPADQLETMAGQAAGLGAATLSRCADILHNGLVEMRGTTAPRLLLELVTARMLLPGADASASALLQRLERLERSGVRGEHPETDTGPDASHSAAGIDTTPVGGNGAGGVSPGGGVSAGGGGKAAAMAAAAAARGGSARPAGGGSARPVSPAAPPPAPAAAPSSAPASESTPSTSPERPSQSTASSGPASPGPGASAPVSSGPGPSAPVSSSPGASGSVSSGQGPSGPASSGPGSAGSASGPVSAGPGSLSDSGSAGGAEGRDEPDWNQVADGYPEPVDSGDYDDEPPPWDDEPVSEAPSRPQPESRPAPAVPARPADRPSASEPAATASQPGRHADDRPAVGDRRDERAERVRSAWQTLGQQQPKVRAMQEYGIGIRDVEGDTVVFAAPTQALVDRFLNWREAIATEFRKSPGGDWRIRCEVGEAGPQRGPARPADGREQPAGRRMSGGSERPAPQAGATASAPERNTGRTEPRPARPSRPPAADADEDRPAAARPATSADSARSAPPPSVNEAVENRPSSGDSGWPEPARSDGGPSTEANAGWPEPVRPAGAGVASDDTGRPEPDRPGGIGAASDDSGHPDPVRQGARSGDRGRPESVRPGGASVASDDTGWPEPVRPGGAGVASDDTGWPEPARPGGGSASADGDTGWPEPARPGSPASGGSAGPQRDASPETWPEAARPGPGASAAAGAIQGGPAAGAIRGGPAAGVARGGPAAAPVSGGGLGGGSAFGGAAVSAGSLNAGPQTTAAPTVAPRSTAASTSPAASASAAAPARSAAMEAARAAARTGVDGASGAAAARAALANARNAPPAGGRAAPSRPAAASGGNAARTWSDAPPVEEAPYDPEYDGPATAYEGFDPGDEPLDDVIDEKTARQSSEEQAIQLLREAFGAEKIAEL